MSQLLGTTVADGEVMPPVESDLVEMASALLQLGQRGSNPSGSLMENPTSSLHKVDSNNQPTVYNADPFFGVPTPQLFYSSPTSTRITRDYSQNVYYSPTPNYFYPVVFASPPPSRTNYGEGIQWHFSPIGAVPYPVNAPPAGYMMPPMSYNQFTASENVGNPIKQEYNLDVTQPQSGYLNAANLLVKNEPEEIIKDLSYNVQQMKNQFAGFEEKTFTKLEDVPSETLMVDRNSHDYVPDLNELNKIYGQKFPSKLWYLATDPHFTPIKWSESGKSLFICQKRLDPLLGHLFRSNKYASFLRQLHLYGFRKMTREGQKKNKTGASSVHFTEYRAHNFQKDRFELLKMLRRSYKMPKDIDEPPTQELSRPASPKTPTLVISFTPPPSPAVLTIPRLSVDQFHTVSDGSINSLAISEASSLPQQLFDSSDGGQSI